MNLRFEPHGDEGQELPNLVNIVMDELGFPSFVVRVRSRDGRERLGHCEALPGNVLALVKPTAQELDGGHGWAAGEKGLVVDMADVEWLECVTDSSSTFPGPVAEARDLVTDPAQGQGTAMTAHETAPSDHVPSTVETAARAPPWQCGPRLHAREGELCEAWIQIDGAVVASAIDLAAAPESYEAMERLRLVVASWLALESLYEDMRPGNTSNTPDAAPEG